MKKRIAQILLTLILCIIMPIPSVFAAVTFHNDNAPGANYVGNWSAESADGSWGSYQQDYKFTSAPGSYCTYTFTGEEVSVMGSYGNDLGMVDVYMDGALHSTIDLYMPTGDMLFQRQLVNIHGLSYGSHTLKMALRADKNPESQGTGFAVDRFDVMTSNRAQDGTVTASSSVEGHGWTAAAVVQAGGSMQGWSSTDQLEADHTEWILIDTLQNSYINEIRLLPAAGGVYFPADFHVEISYDNEQWAKVVDETGYQISGTGEQVFRFPTQLARYIKVTGTQLRQNPLENNWFRMQLAKIEVYHNRTERRNVSSAQAGRTYYVSSSSGDDGNDGMSPSTAWKTLRKASSYRYSAGNSILLKSGDVWDGEGLVLEGSGTETAPIRISSYGSGEKPLIRARETGGFGIHIRNEDGYQIGGLAFSNSVCGIYVENELVYGKKYIDIQNCDFSEIEGTVIGSGDNVSGNLRMPYPTLYFGAGIAFTGTLDGTMRDKTVMSDVTLKNNHFSLCDTGILMFVRDEPYGLDGMPSNAWYFGRKSFDNVHISDCIADKSYRSGGIMLYSVSGLVERCKVTETGYQKGMFWGVAAVQATLCEDLVVDRCEMAYTYLNPGDGEGFDFESGNKNVQLINSVIHDNEGPAILLYGENGGWKMDNEGNVVRNCILYDNGTEGKAYSWSERVFKSYAGRNTGVIEDNFIKLKYPGQPCDPSPHLASGNLIYDEDGILLGLSNKTTVSDWDAAILYSAYGWVMDYNDAYTDGFAHQSRLADAYLEYSFDGTGVNVLGAMLPDGGSFDVFLDGTLVDTVDCQSTQAQYKKTVFSAMELDPGLHTIRLVSKSDAPVSYDGFVVWKPAGAYTETVIDDWDSAVSYTNPGWVMDYHSAYTDGHAHQSRWGGATLTYAFNAEGIKVIGALFPDGGSFDLYLDDVFVDTISCRDAQTQYGHIVYDSGLLPAGSHTIRMVSNDSDPVSYDGFILYNHNDIATDAPTWEEVMASIS